MWARATWVRNSHTWWHSGICFELWISDRLSPTPWIDHESSDMTNICRLVLPYCSNLWYGQPLPVCQHSIHSLEFCIFYLSNPDDSKSRFGCKICHIRWRNFRMVLINLEWHSPSGQRKTNESSPESTIELEVWKYRGTHVGAKEAGTKTCRTTLSNLRDRNGMGVRIGSTGV